MHAALLFWDRLPALPVLTSAAAHMAYLQLLKRFPFFQLLSPEGLASIALLLAANVAWGCYFWRGCVFHWTMNTILCVHCAYNLIVLHDMAPGKWWYRAVGTHGTRWSTSSASCS